jgi:1-acyl-sn-glycerol-3-phosphate acyltransferase
LTFIRSFVFNIYFFVMTLVMCVTATVARWFRPAPVLPFAARWAQLILWGLRVICGIRVSVTGREHIPDDAALIASAHQSAFDTLIWLTLVPRCCYVLKQELLRIPLFGSLIAASGMIAIDRSSGAAALRSLLKDGPRAIREGRQIVIFPEGTRAAYGARLPLQPGIAALAKRTNLPVIPVATDSGLHWGRRAFQKYPGTIRVVVGSPVPGTLPRDELMSHLSDALRMPDEGRGAAVENSVD